MLRNKNPVRALFASDATCMFYPEHKKIRGWNGSGIFSSPSISHLPSNFKVRGCETIEQAHKKKEKKKTDEERRWFRKMRNE